MENKIPRFRFIPFATTVVIVCCLVLVATLALGNKSFPNVPHGAFTGKISGFADDLNQFSTLYIERTGEAGQLLVVVFRKDWLPQIVRLVPLKKVSSKEESIDFEPITISGPKNEYTLFGRRSGSGFSGELMHKEEKRGLWSVTPVSAEALRNNSLSEETQSELKEWLQIKSFYHKKTDEFHAIKKRRSDMQKQYRLLSSYLKEKNKLLERSHSRITGLNTEVAALEKDVTQGRSEIKQLVRNLQQLTRITRRGRIVDLARRVSKRENKWYFVNWQQGEDLSSIEESLAERMNIDLIKLKERVNRANEMQTLKNTIAREKAKVIELQKIYREKLDSEKQRQHKKKRQPKQPWWNRWDTVFGVFQYD